MNCLKAVSHNWDFQCSVVYTSARIGSDLVTVHHCCKDLLPSIFWMVVCVGRPLRYVYIDSRDIGGTDNAEAMILPGPAQRQKFIELLQRRFKSVDDLMTWATETGRLIVTP